MRNQASDNACSYIDMYRIFSSNKCPQLQLGLMKALLLYLVAPFVVALLAPFAMADAFELYPPIFLIGTVPVAYFFSLLVAVPMFLTLEKANRTDLLLILGISFLAGTLSFFVFNIVFHGSFSSVNDVVLIQNGQLSLAGWKDLLERSLRMGALSLPGGLCVWLGAKQEARCACSSHP
jgi:hypothetical protein